MRRRLDGVKAKELKAFMEGYDRAALPNVEQGKEKNSGNAAPRTAPPNCRTCKKKSSGKTL